MDRQSSPKRSRRWPFRRKRPLPLLKIALLPAMITLGNGVCGVVAIQQVGLGLMKIGENGDPTRNFQKAALLILIAMILDALDGFVARLTKTASSFGAQLDTLCDLVTFGIAPAMLVFAVTRDIAAQAKFWDRSITAVCVLYAICALVRLARFTVETTPDESSHREFAGLPSPAAAGVIAGALIPWPKLFGDKDYTWVEAGLPGLTFALGILMVSRFKYVHVVTRLLRGKRPFITIVELSMAAAMIYLFQGFAVFLAFFGYALVGPFTWLRTQFFKKPAPSGTNQPSAVPQKKTTLL